jgi:hypothetical protein
MKKGAEKHNWTNLSIKKYWLISLGMLNYALKSEIIKNSFRVFEEVQN